MEAMVAAWKADAAAEKAQWPPCNSRWAAGEGNRFWCTSRSGGPERGWVGYPRKMFKRGKPEEVQCTCAKEKDVFSAGEVMLELYPGCAAHADSCSLPE
jgi:hypothetical protein